MWKLIKNLISMHEFNSWISHPISNYNCSRRFPIAVFGVISKFRHDEDFLSKS